jgi:hypothetical protein
MNDIMLAYNGCTIDSSFRNFEPLYDICVNQEYDRSPRSVQKSASSIGMVIPPKMRQGIKAYNYFIDQFRYYHEVIYHEFAQATIDNLHLLSDTILLSYLPASVSTGSKSWSSRRELENKVRDVLLKQQLLPLSWKENLYYCSTNNIIYSRDELNKFPVHNGYILLSSSSSSSSSNSGDNYVKCP